MKNKQILLIVITVLIILVIGFFAVGRSFKKNTNDEALLEQEVIPTVDASVKVSLESALSKKDVILKIESIPNSTKEIEYELSYETKGQGLQGVIGTIKLKSGEKDYEKQITLGTCSSGTCVYHEVSGPIKLSLRFSGKYGQRIFEKEYKL